MNVYEFTVKDNKNNEVSLASYKGKALLIVNTATGCGFTPQYKDLQELYEKYQKQGFEVLDFPCNQFGGQAPGSADEIDSFCTVNYNTTFPRFAKGDVNGEQATPLFKSLTANTKFGGFDLAHRIGPILVDKLSAVDPDYMNKSDIKWNFTKFLVDRNGELVERFEPTTLVDVVEEKLLKLL